MPTAGSYRLSDVTIDRIVIECPACQRRGVFATARLVEQYGPDMALPDLKTMLVECRNVVAAAGLDGCKARYSAETVRSWLTGSGASIE